MPKLNIFTNLKKLLERIVEIEFGDEKVKPTPVTPIPEPIPVPTEPREDK